MIRWRLMILGVAAALSMLVIGRAVLDTSNRSSENSTIIGAIQQERVRNTLANCRDQNTKHDSTIRTLDSLIKQAGRVHPSQRAQLEASEAFTVLLVDKLAPKHHCMRQAQNRVGSATQ